MADSLNLTPAPARPGRVLVVGAAVLDRIFYVDHLPAPGETAIGHRMELFPGGKGANQALAARKLGADVSFISAVGEDEAARIVLAPLEEAGINTDGVVRVPEHATAEAVISVDDRGENQITACPGAYHALTPDHLEDRRELFEAADWLLVQFELPVPTVTHAIALAKEYGLNVVFNPDPYTRKSSRPPRGLHTLIPNEQQAAAILGVKDYMAVSPSDRPMQWTRAEVENVVVTLGRQGVEWVHGDQRNWFAATEGIDAVDTVGAGDQFCGAYTAFVSEGLPVEQAVQFANLAAGLSVEHRGAQAGQRTRAQLIEHLSQS